MFSRYRHVFWPNWRQLCHLLGINPVARGFIWRPSVTEELILQRLDRNMEGVLI